MTDLEQQLTDHLRRRAAAATPRYDLEAVEQGMTDPDARPHSVARPPARSLWRAVAVAAVVALIVATGVTVTRNRDRGTGVTTTPGPTGVTTSPGPTEVFPDLRPDATVALPPGPISAGVGGAAVWTGTELIVWGEPPAPDASPPPEGAAFNPETGTWRIIAQAPIQRASVLAWTGSEMIAWGGVGSDDGAAYDPEADTWRRLPKAPIASGDAATAVWTGNELIVLSDVRNGLGDPLEAAAYDPSTDEWRALADTNGDLSPFISPAIQDHASEAVWTGTTVLTIVDVSAVPFGPTDGSGRGLARYDLSTDTWHIDADAHYATLVGVPDTDGVTRTVLAMPVEPGRPVDLLDAAGNPIGSMPAHPLDLGGSITDATGLWLGREALFWIRGADWLLRTAEGWALDPATGTWRPLPGDAPSEAVAVGDVLLQSDGAEGIAYRAPT